MADIYDVAIVGGGVAGSFAALRLAEKHNNIKTILIEWGRPPFKRRRACEGFLGCFPSSDGKLYVDDLLKVKQFVDGRKVRHANNWVFDYLMEVNSMKLIKDSLPQQSIVKKIKEIDFSVTTNSYYQWKPDSIHLLSRNIAEQIETGGNIELSFDNQVYNILKRKGNFLISTANGDILCKKVILAVGRSGWRWCSELYKELGLTIKNDTANFGIRVEIAGQYMKEWNRSHCTLIKKNLELGPFSWSGTIIPEDHIDVVLSSFRSNEERWKSDKVSFSLLSSRYFKNQGTYQTDRLSKLAFLLFNERVSKEKLKLLMKKKSVLSMVPEYDWLPAVIEELESFIPNLITRGYYHVPNILPMVPEISINSHLETEIEGLFVAGESAGVRGIMAAALMGAVVGDSVCK